MVYVVCKPCQKGKHAACESPMEGGVDCHCANPDCMWMRKQLDVN